MPPKTGDKKASVKAKAKGQPVRLYVKGCVLGFRRGLRNQHESSSLLKIDGVQDKKDVDFYLGKRVVYIYKAHRKDKEGSAVRTIWGRVARAHGSNGAVRAKFQRNLPARAMGGRVRVMLYPSRV